jgi:hypothetical protein
VNIRTLPLNIEHNLNEIKSLFNSEYEVRKNDNSKFYQVSNRFVLDEYTNINGSNNYDYSFQLRGGDCFVNMVTMRMQRNFVDPNVPNAEEFADRKTWSENYKGYGAKETTDYTKINSADLNTVQIGSWYTYICLSNYNLALRSEDKSHSDEINKLGSWRSFYPLSDMNVKTSGKVADSALLNLGYSSVLSDKYYTNISSESVSYANEDYSTRIMFSDPYVLGEFDNGYRVFKGINYFDYPTEYGSITKLVNVGGNLLCVFEHAVGIIPINEKALLSTEQGASIHLYGEKVLGEQIKWLSTDYGSKWKSSIVKTANGIYGLDLDNKLIWRYEAYKGFSILSDFKVKKLFNDYIKNKNILYETFLNGIATVRTHYNKDK